MNQIFAHMTDTARCATEKSSRGSMPRNRKIDYEFAASAKGVRNSSIPYVALVTACVLAKHVATSTKPRPCLCASTVLALHSCGAPHAHPRKMCRKASVCTACRNTKPLLALSAKRYQYILPGKPYVRIRAASGL